MKKLFYILLLLGSTYVFAQNKGMTYQAVIYAPGGQNVPGVNVANVPMTNRTICLQFSLLDASSGLEYQEVVKTKTDEFGMVNITIGSGTQTGGYATSFGAVVWSASADKSMKVALDATGLCNQYEELSVEKLDAVPFANAAITAGNVTGVVALTNGGTGATTAAGARTNLGIGNVDNTSDLNKPMSTATKTYVDSQLTNSTIVDADANTKGKVQLAGDLAGTAAAPTVPGLALKENATNKSTTTTLGTSNVLFPTQNAVKTYVDTAIAGATIVDADANTKGKIQLAGDLAGTAAAPTVPGLALKENAANKSTTTTLGTSNVLFPTQNAVKTYVDTAIAGATIVDADANTKGKIRLAGDLSGTAAAPTVPGLALKLDASLAGVPNGIATLNSAGIIPANQLPPISVASTNVVGSQAAMLALSNATVGSIAVRTDVNKNFILSTAGPSVLANWIELLTPGAPVQSVNGLTGAIQLSKADINLANVDNTSDAAKPVSTATQNALNLKLNTNQVGVPNGTASLNALGKIPTEQIPAISFSSVKVLASQAEMLAQTNALIGSVVIRTDVNKNYVLAQSDPTILANWVELLTPAPPVQSVNGYVGNLSLTKADLGLGNVDNTGDINKPVSTPTQNALDLKANLASPSFTGTVSGITKSMVGLANVDNTTDLNKPVSTATQTALDLKANTVDLTAETTRATAAEATLTTNVATNATAIAAETTRATAAEATLTTNVATNATAIAAETTRATAAEATLTTNVATNTTAIAAETTRATAAEATLTTNVATNATAIAAETTRATAAETTLTTNLAAEVTRATAAEALKANATDVTTSLALKANLASPTFTGTPTAPTPATADNSTTIATTEYVKNSIVAANAGLSTIGNISATSNAKGAVINGTTELVLTPADATNGGVVTTGAQTFAGAKTFNSDIKVNDITVGGGSQTYGNTALGYLTLASNQPASYNAGSWNTAIGHSAMYRNTNGNYNTAIGKSALTNNTTGKYNTAIGYHAGSSLYTVSSTFPTDNTLIGTASGMGITTGSFNTIIGSQTYNVVSGYPVGIGITTGSNNTIIGSKILGLSPTLSNNVILADGSGNIRAQHDGANGWTLGTISSGTWNGTEIAITKGGTGAITAAAALTNLGAEPTANKSTATDLGNTAPSDQLFPSQKAVKAYVDSSVSSGAPDATTATSGKIKLAGDLSGTAALPIVAAGAISEAKLAADAVTSAKIKDGEIVDADVSSTAAIAYSKLNLASSIVVGDLADNAVETAKIKNLNVTTDKLAANAVTTAKITDANITYAKIQNVSATDKVLGRVSTGAGVVEEIATTGSGDVVRATSPTLVTPVLGAATGTSLSVSGQLTSTVATGTAPFVVTSTTPVANLSIGGNAATVTTNANLTGDVTSSGNATTIATDAVTSTKILDGTIANADVSSTAAIAYSKLNLASSIVVGDLANNAVETNKIKDAAVEEAKIKDAAVTYAKIQNVSATDKVLGRVSTGAGVVEEIATTGSGNVVRATSPTLVTPVLGAATGTSLSVSGQLTSTVATGTAPLVVTSTTPVANLSIGGNAATVTTNADLTGDVTSSGNATTIGANKVVTGMIADGTIVVGDLATDAVEEAKIKDSAVTSAKIKDGEIVNADLSASAAIADTKLATIATAGKVSNSATTATDANTASAIVSRDANGNFTAGTITANLTGLASKATNLNGGSLGDIAYQSAANTSSFLSGNTSATKKFLTQTGTGSAAVAPAWGTVGTADITDLGANVATFLATPSSVNLFNAMTNKTGTGSLVFNTSPTLFSPTLGIASATSVAFSGATSGTATIAAPAVAGTTTITLPGATGTLATLAGTETLTNKTLTSPILTTPTIGVATATSVAFSGDTSGTATIVAPAVAGTTTITLPGATGTLATLAGTETLTNKTLTTPNIGVATATSINKVTITAPSTGATLTIAEGKTLTANNSIVLAGTDGKTMTFPTTDATIARTDAAQTFSGLQTFSPAVTAASALATGTKFTPTLTAAADADILVGLDINPTFSNGSYAGLTNYALRVQGIGFGRGGGAVETNTAIGSGVLIRNSTGANNTGLGYRALLSNTTGSGNTAFGSFAGAYIAATGSGGNASGTNSTFIGYNTSPLTDGDDNEVVIAGGNATTRTVGLGSNTTLIGNAATTLTALKGDVAIGSTTDGGDYKLQVTGNTKLTGTLTVTSGAGAGKVLTSDANGLGTWTTSNAVPYTGATGAVDLGAYDLKVNGLTVGRGNTGDGTNTALGGSVLQANTAGTDNTAVGYYALKTTTGSLNSAFGSLALKTNTSGSRNAAFGTMAVQANSLGDNNSGFGYGTLYATTASDNTGIGYLAGYNVTSGAKNIFIGSLAGNSISTASTANTTGLNSVLIGYDVRPLANADTNEIVLSGYNGTAGTVGLGSNSTTIGNSATKKSQIYGALTTVPAAAASSGVGESSIIEAQGSSSSSAAGSVTINAGDNSSSGAGGDINLNPGTSSTGTAGKVYVNGGDMVVNGNNIGAGKFTGVGNILFGSGALNINTRGRYNIAIGESSLSGFNPASASNTYNIALGYSALSGATNTGINNIAIGSSTMGAASLSGQSNIAIGSSSLSGLTTGSYNNAVGQQSMSSGAVTGTENNAFGMLTLNSITGGTNNSAFGSRALNGLTSGHNNIGIGAYALYTNTVARNNTSIGNFSLRYINGTADDGVGAFNTALGFQAGTYVGATGTSTTNVTGKGSVFLGYDTRPLNNGDTNEVVISGFSGSAGTAGMVGKGSNTTTIGNDATTDTYIYGNLIVSGQVKLNSTSAVLVLSKTASYDIATTDNANLIVFKGSTASQTIKLPAASANIGREITIKNIATVSVSIASAGGYLISDSSTTTAATLAIGIEPSNNWIKAISDGTDWIILRALF